MQSLASRQARYFATLMTVNLCPEAVDVCQTATDLLDFGCNMGDGTQAWADRFPHLEVTGLDINEAAIEMARSLYAGCYFTPDMPAAVDVLVTSNVLEHFEDPHPYMEEHFQVARRLYVVLVPWQERNRVPGHLYTFTEADFVAPDGWHKLQHTILPPDTVFWGGEQVLVAYGRQHG